MTEYFWILRKTKEIIRDSVERPLMQAQESCKWVQELSARTKQWSYLYQICLGEDFERWAEWPINNWFEGTSACTNQETKIYWDWGWSTWVVMESWDWIRLCRCYDMQKGSGRIISLEWRECRSYPWRHKLPLWVQYQVVMADVMLQMAPGLQNLSFPFFWFIGEQDSVQFSLIPIVEGHQGESCCSCCDDGARTRSSLVMKVHILNWGSPGGKFKKMRVKISKNGMRSMRSPHIGGDRGLLLQRRPDGKTLPVIMLLERVLNICLMRE